MKKSYIYIVFSIIIFIIASCSKDDSEIVQEPVKSNAKQILSFVFRAEDNAALNEDIEAIINEDSKLINTTVPYGTNITELIPSITISESASITPTGIQNFTSVIKYEVSAQDASVVTYDAKVNVTPNNEKQILSFVFRAEDNELYGDETITATIDDAKKTITATVSYSSNATLLTPSIEVSPNATISPAGAQDFKGPVIYTLTAEDGSTTTYQIVLETTFTDRDALIAIYNANPNNTLNWDLQEKDISTWQRVVVDADNNIIRLYLNDKSLDKLPPEIGRLTNLLELELSGNILSSIPSEFGALKSLVTLSIENNQITELSSAIGELSSLQSLNLRNNQLSQIPSEIGKLTNLQYLEIDDNQLIAIPASIGELSNLAHMELGYNKLTVIPPQIGQLKKLESLAILHNQLTSIPKEIRNLTSLTSLSLNSNELESIPAELGNLFSLTGLYLSDNQLTLIPKEIGKLKNLRRLYLNENSLTTIPQAVCNLANTGTDVQFDAEVICQ
ncbi:leucine-rich repeat domain-containing protein [Maribacter sp. IgM3_T14_3]|uniref:leucine-rich repeat domain-containing protein n=1 Tax=Maribacter sp. IgM3_T14_3 TaxID=3415140 RepID=UPI003C6F6388